MTEYFFIDAYFDVTIDIKVCHPCKAINLYLKESFYKKIQTKLKFFKNKQSI